MNWDAIGAIGEILGSLAVLVSLIYLAAQIKSNTQQLKFDASNSVANSADRGMDPVYSEPCMSIWNKGHRSYTELSADERHIFDALMVRSINNFQSMIFARREGLIEEEIFQRTHIGWYSSLVHSNGGAEWFENGRKLFIPEVAEMLREKGE